MAVSITERGVIGLIAGGGRLPFMVACGAKAAGRRVVCVGLAGYVDPALAQEVDVFYEVAIARPGSWIRRLRRHGVTDTIMVGTVTKSHLFTPRRILRYIPDWRAFRIYYWRLRGRTKQTDVILTALADELATGGIRLEDSTMYCEQYLADSGVMTKHQPSAQVQSDIAFGWPLAKQLGQMDIGQAIAVREREVIAVEAIEGTAEMIRRAGQFCKAGGWTLIKTAKPQQDPRFDVPCVGPDTIESLAANGAVCLAIEAGKTIVIDKPQTIALADRLGICIIGR
ncbi:MAG TPA: UDP-2,3-diacylglucosamine diphosphatase LpxI [Sedimentisphaerales bacterium]|nr:UDP-2,3-diacylglucosamine diphosphatase LpxI [Sedimentisphaerales bacterium]HRS09792.1 UDP-2,3-diacylglucosamine diphosphatase LpxI [Sedimentisphaerales bacterium]HRV46558.1 UDP-2,3-diacylglucosamine diphosphatase LpxI [Sedimentisphaerales bacterium]